MLLADQPGNSSYADIAVDRSAWQICKSLMTDDDTGVEIGSHVVWARVHALSVFTAADASGIDSDGDGLPDLWEAEYGLDPSTYTDPSADPDGDGLPNNVEAFYGTDPLNVDSDGDTLTDGTEINDYRLFLYFQSDEQFFSPASETYLDLSSYPSNASYLMWLNGTATVNASFEPLLGSALMLRNVSAESTEPSHLEEIALGCNIERAVLTNDTKIDSDEVWLESDPNNREV